MTNAIYTVRSLEELRAIRQPHPLRSVSNGDVVHLIGDTTRDECTTFKATITNEPVNDLPSSIASDDGLIQWDIAAKGYFHGGVPNSISINGLTLSGGPPEGWVRERVRGKFYAVAPLQEYMSYISHSCEYVNNRVWVTTDNIIEVDLDSNSATVYPVGTLTDGQTDLAGMGRCYSKSEDVIHIIDTAGNHHIFDIATTTMNLDARASHPANGYGSVMIDASIPAGKLFYISKDYSEPYDLYEYNISLDTWTLIYTFNGELACWAPDPDNSTKFIIVSYAEGVFELDSVTSTVSLKHDVSGYKTIAQPYYTPAAMLWDKYSGLFYVPNGYYYMLYYDPVTGDSGVSTDDKFDALLGRTIGSSMATLLSEGVYFFLDDSEADSYWSVVLTPYFVHTKVRP